MKLVVTLLLVAGSLLAQTKSDTPPQQRGPKGGCYVIAKAKKDGHEYKRYQKCKEAKK